MAANVVSYGFMGLEALFEQRAAEANLTRINDAIAASTAEYNRVVSEIFTALVERTTQPQERYDLPGAGTLQALDEAGWGNPRPTRPGGYYTVGYPIQGAGDAFGTNRVSRQMITVGELNRQVVDVQTRDLDWLRRHALAALFDNTSYVFEDSEFGTLTVYPLANGDGTVYPITGGGVPATRSHYLAQAADILDASNPFPTIASRLRGIPGQTGTRVVAYAATDLLEDIKALNGFVPVGDADVVRGLGTETVTNVPPIAFGTEVIGKVDGVWVVEYPQMPSGYVLAIASDADPVLAMREYPVGSLQGLFTEGPWSPNGNVQESRWIRYAGFGARNRTGAVVLQVGSATYTIPTGFTTPLAV